MKPVRYAFEKYPDTLYRKRRLIDHYIKYYNDGTIGIAINIIRYIRNVL